MFYPYLYDINVDGFIVPFELLAEQQVLM